MLVCTSPLCIRDFPRVFLSRFHYMYVRTFILFSLFISAQFPGCFFCLFFPVPAVPPPKTESRRARGSVVVGGVFPFSLAHMTGFRYFPCLSSVGISLFYIPFVLSA